MASAVQIVDRCKRGESAAFAELIAAHQDAVYTVAFCTTGDPVLSEDITQDTFLQAYCGRVLGTIDQLLDEYKGKLRVVSKMFPVKPGSKLLARAATAAGRQGRFWQMTDLLYTNQDKPMPDKAQLIAYAKQLGLDTAAFACAYDSPARSLGSRRSRPPGRRLRRPLLAAHPRPTHPALRPSRPGAPGSSGGRIRPYPGRRGRKPR